MATNFRLYRESEWNGNPSLTQKKVEAYPPQGPASSVEAQITGNRR